MPVQFSFVRRRQHREITLLESQRDRTAEVIFFYLKEKSRKETENVSLVVCKAELGSLLVEIQFLSLYFWGVVEKNSISQKGAWDW